MIPKTISIVVAAFNEEKNIEAAIDSVTGAMEGFVSDYEIIVVNDGSIDRTGALAEARAKKNPRVKVIHNKTNGGFGCTFARGVRQATKEYVTGFPGDNDASALSLRDIIQAVDGEDLVITYAKHIRNRSVLRNIISKTFVLFLNILFGLNLKYYNGLLICRRELFQSIPIKSTGLAAIAECVVRLIKSGCSYKEICFEHTGRQYGRSTALSLRSLKSVTRTILILIQDIYFAPPRREEICSTL